MDIHIKIEGREEVRLQWDENSAHVPRLLAVGSLEFLELIQDWREKLKGAPPEWPLPPGSSTGAVLLREVILRARGEWNPPYEEEELCHCRAIPLKKVEDAIRAGAHTSEKVSRWTSASTACGTCRPDVEALLKYFLLGA